jgi:branched-chain amino acid transport system permease protein
MNRASIAVAVGAACVAVPWVIGNAYYVNLASQILIYALLALSLNLLLGYGGLVSLGHAAFLGLTGYSTILLVLAGYDQLTTAILSVAFSTACGALFGVLSLRATGIGFLMITLALGQIVWGVAYRANDLTGGDNGITLPARPAPFGIDINSSTNFYYFTLIVFAIALFCIWRLTRSPFGAALCGTRDQPRRMSMLGHNVWMVQWLTFVIASFWGSISGMLYIYYNLFMSPHAISLQQSAEALLMAILGGASTLTGPIIGAAVITIVKNVVSTYIERWNILLGLIFVIVIMFMPSGLVPGCRQLWRRLARTGPGKPAASAAPAREAGGQRGNAMECAPGTHPAPGSSARGASEPAA